MALTSQAESFDVPLAAAVLYERDEFREPLRAAVAAAGVSLACEVRLSEVDARLIGELQADVLVVNLEQVLDRRPEILDRILSGRGARALVFNDADASERLHGTDRARWARHLASKILGKDRVLPPHPEEYAPPPVAAPAEFEVWVLGASIGGPEAVRTFLSNLDPPPPVALVLAQHIGSEFVQLMAAQLNQVSKVPVRYAHVGDEVLPGRVLIVPVDRHFTIDAEGRVGLEPVREETPYSPCIDQVLDAVAERFRTRANAIIFSGMSRDGVAGAARLIGRGGEVWVQHPDTCVVSSMVDGTMAGGGVGLVASPTGLAEALAARRTPGEQARKE